MLYGDSIFSKHHKVTFSKEALEIFNGYELSTKAFLLAEIKMFSLSAKIFDSYSLEEVLSFGFCSFKEDLREEDFKHISAIAIEDFLVFIRIEQRAYKGGIFSEGYLCPVMNVLYMWKMGDVISENKRLGNFIPKVDGGSSGSGGAPGGAPGGTQGDFGGFGGQIFKSKKGYLHMPSRDNYAALLIDNQCKLQGSDITVISSIPVLG